MKISKLNTLIIIGLTVLFSACSEEEKTTTEEKTVTVKTRTIDYNGNASPTEYIGTVESDNQMDVSFLVIGTVEKMYANEGQKVSKGQLLASINKTSLQHTHSLAEASLKQAQDAYKRMSAMYESKSLPEIQFIDVKTKLEQAQASEAITRKNLEDGNIYAPQSGIIGKRYLEPGASAMPGSPVYQIIDIRNVKVKAAVPEGEISGIKAGTLCNVKISALGDQIFQGKVAEKVVVANPVSHTYDVKIQLDNSSGTILPGMVCKAYISTKTSTENEIVIPIKAVQVDTDGKRFVWVKSKENKAGYKAVELGKLIDNGVEIKSGLSIGDELIVEGYQNVSPGVSVAVYNK